MELAQFAAISAERKPDQFDEMGTAGLRALDSKVLATLLDVVDYGILLVRADHTVGCANHAARLDLAKDHPLLLTGSTLTARHRQDSGPLRASIDSALRKGIQCLLTLGEHTNHSVCIAVLPINDADVGKPGQAVLVLGKRAVCGDLSTEAFARQHGLTPAELRILKQLCAGHPAAEIAKMQGVALTTVRTQISSVRDKTGSQTIGALVRSVARLPPLVTRLRAAA